MKKNIAALAAASLLLATGCSSDKSNNTNMESDFNKSISQLSQQGFTVTKNNKNYILTINDKDLVTKKILDSLGVYTLNNQYNDYVSKMINGKKLSIEIDWDKYNKAEANSVHVRTIETNNTNDQIEAYLSFDKNQEIINFDFKQINVLLDPENNESDAVLKLENLNLALDRANKDAIDYDLKAPVISILSTKEDINIKAEQTSCQWQLDDDRAGYFKCNIPTIAIVSNKGSKTFKISDTSLNNVAEKKSKKLFSLADLTIASVTASSTKNSNKLAVSNIKLNSSSNVNLETIRKLRGLYKKLNPANKDFKEQSKVAFKTAGEIFNEMNATYNIALDKITYLSESNNSFTLSKYSQKGNIESSKEFAYSDNVNIEKILLVDGNKTMLKLSNLKYNTQMQNLLNIFPEYFAIVGELQAVNNPENINDKDMDKITTFFTGAFQRIVNHGLDYSVKALEFDNIVVPSSGGKNITMSKASLNLAAVLSKNNITLNGPMSSMALTQFLNADGKVVLKKEDLQAIISQMPQAGMALMLAKEDGENSIFEIEFKNGHLKINGTPLM